MTMFYHPRLPGFADAHHSGSGFAYHPRLPGFADAHHSGSGSAHGHPCDHAIGRRPAAFAPRHS